MSVRIETKKFDLWVIRIIKKYRSIVFRTIAEEMDRIRISAADKHIIRNMHGYNLSPWALAKLQPAHPTKVTERTGLLRTMLKLKSNPMGSGWKFTERRSSKEGFSYATVNTARLNTNTLKGIVRVSGGQNTPEEKYCGKLSEDMSSTQGLINSKMAKWRKETVETMRARFLHDRGSSKFSARPNISLAVAESQLTLTSLMRQRMLEIGRIY
jgi:hypothetical protein